MTKIPVVVQARMSSTRLPGKVMMPFLGKTFLESCIDRCAQIQRISEVIVATTDRSDCDSLADLAERRGYRVVRGSQDDVLSRYLSAARSANADAVVRITSDCPLIDPQIASQVVARFLEADYDLVTTNIPPSWPNGMDVEIFTRDALEAAAAEALLKSEREHVSTFIRQRPMRFKLGSIPCPDEGCANWRLTLDTPADRDFLLAVQDQYGDSLSKAGWSDLHAFLENRPDLLAINSETPD